MYARITTFSTVPERYEDAKALAEELKPEIMALPGIKFWFDLANEDGSGAVVAIYDSKESAEAALPAVREIFGKFSEHLASEPQPHGYDVFVHGVNP